MTTDQKKQYEEAARECASSILGIGPKYIPPDDTIIFGFMSACESIHPLIDQKDRVIDSLRKIIKDNERISDNEISDKDNEIHRLNLIYSTLESSVDQKEREAYNHAINDVIRAIEETPTWFKVHFTEELKKLRK